MKVFYNISLLFFIFTSSTYALSPEKRLENEQLETRARNLFLKVRCLVCNGQVIENSDTEFSLEMRKLIRKKITQGLSDKEIKKQLVQTFGNDILIDSSTKNSMFLWILPMIFATGALILLVKKYK